VANIGQNAASKIKHAHILLQVDAHGPSWSDAHVAQAFRCHGHPVRNVRHRCADQGLAAALARQKPDKPSRQRRLDGAKAAHGMARWGSQPSEGSAKWTLQLLAETLVEFAAVATISYATVR